MSDGHFRSLQPRNGQGLHEKSASKKVLILKKSGVKIPLVMSRLLPDVEDRYSQYSIQVHTDPIMVQY